MTIGMNPQVPKNKRAIHLLANDSNVPGVGLEPTRPEGHEILSLACLPIPPSRLVHRSLGEDEHIFRSLGPFSVALRRKSAGEQNSDSL